MGALLGLKDYRAGLDVVGAMACATTSVATFARTGVHLLNRNIGAEITTLSECDLVSGRRTVVTTPGVSIGTADRACFDRHFNEHPLVRFHAHAGGRTTHRISDSIPFTRFRNTSLFNEYYRHIGIDHAIALPVYVDERLLVSFVLNRLRTDFTDREVAWLDNVRDALAALYRNARLLQAAQVMEDDPPALSDARMERWRLTPREREMLRFVALGKTDREIGALAGVSVRTVHKHLQRIYEKLGVETRTAAVMRVVRAR
jgi:DNA-binding CsgD family transcriptional regulator